MPPNFCPNCGIKIKADNSERCPKCGIKIGSKCPQIPTPSSPPLLLDSKSLILPSSGKIGVTEAEEGNKKNRVNIAVVLISFIIIAGVFAFVVFGAGFFTPHTSQQNVVTTIPTPTIALASGALVPLPTDLIPSNQKLYFQVKKNAVTSKISVIFAGSAGEGSIKSADIKVTHPDGSVAMGIIQPLRGINEITLDGSEGTDRVEIIAKMSSGVTYRAYDNLVPLGI
jgi:hypothetical protein